jgi:ElaB/YqjD/DUF883 family membrane-anchored ribosome-binding protein
VRADPERARLEAAIARHRGELRSALLEVKAATVDALTPAEHLRRRPYPWLAAAAAVGFWLAHREGRAS